jgi:hypothetical protein
VAYFFIFFSIFVSLSAFAESATSNLGSSKSLQQADADAHLLCARLKANPTCKENLGLMRNTLGLTVASCLAERQAAKCDAFVAKFPEYKSKQMSCEPYEVCKLALNSTLGEGCARYGVEVTTSFLQLLQSTGACFSSVSCSGEHFISALLTLVNPGQAALKFGMNVAAQTVSGLANDRDKYRSVACLDPETQMQFGCYLAFKYGSAAFGVAGATRAGASAMIARMARVEVDLASAELRAASKGIPEKSKDLLPRVSNDVPPTVTVARFSGKEVLSPKRFFPKIDPGGPVKVIFKNGEEITGRLVEEHPDYLLVEVAGKTKKILRDANFANFGIADMRDMTVRTFVRSDEGIAQVDQNYLHNIASAKKVASADFDSFAADQSQFTFLEKLKHRHTVASGRGTNVIYNGADSEVKTSEVSPGVFRDESPFYRQFDKRGGAILKASAAHLVDEFDRLKKLGIVRKPRPQIQNYDSAIKQAQMDGSLTRGDQLFPSNPEGAKLIHYYPASETLPIWRKLTYDRYKDAFNAIQKVSGPKDLAGALDKVADYYHTAINSHMFGRINASLFMNDVNVMLRKLRIHEISHGDLDFFATALDYQDFRKVFVTYVRDKVQ